MKRKCLSLLLLTFLSYHAFAQSKYTVKGAVLDTASGKKLMNTSISVLRSKDSTLVKYTRADESGRFLISSLPPGKMFLLVTYPGFCRLCRRVQIGQYKKQCRLWEHQTHTQSKIAGRCNYQRKSRGDKDQRRYHRI